MHKLRFTSINWKGQYKKWKNVIKIIMRHQRPMSIIEVKGFMNYRYTKCRDLMEYMYECGVLTKPYKGYYNINWENIRDSIIITDDEEEYEEYEEELTYIKYAQLYGEKYIEKLMKQGIEDDETLSRKLDEYIIERMENLKKSRARIKRPKHTDRYKSHNSMHKLWEDGTIGKLLKGEISIEEYEKRAIKKFKD